ncbi:hypothetical protein C7R93_09355 [Brevibacillus fortis]|uniref:Uncharacterized protein n=1 Tax=Brevibacillus fortis TaxID=2126352 RepID=A0A2P7VDK3_9BACL|nr:hypothetical protein C7R93_09355 [Brevibacillus fortis]
MILTIILNDDKMLYSLNRKENEFDKYQPLIPKFIWTVLWKNSVCPRTIALFIGKSKRYMQDTIMRVLINIFLRPAFESIPTYLPGHQRHKQLGGRHEKSCSD